MPNQIQSGTVMVRPSVFLRSLGTKGEPYCQDWHSLDGPDSTGLDHKVRAAGWNLFFMAGEISAVVPAWGGQNTICRGVKRLLAQTRLQHFNCLELSQIVRKRFFGVPYICITGHPRHIQRSGQLRTIQQREQDHNIGDSEPASASNPTPEPLAVDGCLQS